MPTLSERNLKRFLEYYGIDAEILEFEDSVMGSQRAKEMVKESGLVIKTIVLMCDEAKPFICILRGERRVDLEKVKELTGCESLRLAKAKEVKQHVGYDVGGVPPFGHLKNFETIVDEEVERLEDSQVLFSGGGSHYHLMRIRKGELMRVLSDVVKNVKVGKISE